MGIAYTNTLKNSRFYVEFQEVERNINGNYTVINWQAGLEINGGDIWYSNAVRLQTIWINDVEVYGGGTFSNINGYGKHQLASGTLTIPHNSDGNKSFSIVFSGWLYDYGETFGNSSFTLTSIPRYLSILDFFVVEVDIDRAEFYWRVSDPRNQTYYELNLNGNWIGSASYGESVSADNKSGYFWVKNLNPNTTYSIKVKIHRTDSGLVTYSNLIQFTTKAPAKISNANNLILGNNTSISINKPSIETAKLFIKIGETTIKELEVNNGNNNITFTANECKEMFKKMINNKSINIKYEVVSVIDGVNTNPDSVIKTLSTNYTGKTGYYNNKHCQVWYRNKKAFIWLKENGVWKRTNYERWEV